MATPSLAMIPSAYADSKVYSVLPNNGDGDFTFNRDSSATRVGQNGLIQEVGYFGSELIVNGDFSNGGANWNYNVSQWSFSSGTADCNGTQTSLSYLNQSGAIVSGKVYKATYEVTSITAGEIRVFVGDVSGLARTTVGVYTEYITAASTNFWLRGSSTFVGSIDNVSVQEVLGDQPRLNYDISNGVVQSCPSLLLEPASTNLITYSEDFSQSVWNKISSTEIISNNSISPNGSLNSDKVNASTTYNGILGFQDGFSVSSSSDYSVSFFAKKGNLRYLQLFHGGGQVVGNARTNFDLENGIVTVSDSGHDASIEDYGNGWFRCIVSLEAFSTTLQLYFNAVKDANATRSAASDFNENDNLFIWGIQLEQLNYPTSYIPTNGSTQTRAAETCNGAGTSSILPSEEGILYCEIEIPNISTTNSYPIAIFGTGATIQIYYRSASQSISFLSSVGGIQYLFHSAINPLGKHKLALAYKQGRYSAYIDGSLVNRQNSGNVPANGTLNTLSLADSGSSSFFGKVRDIRVYNTKEMTDSEVDILLTKITS